MNDFDAIDLTTEQKSLIEYALAGYNVMCNACIGSGKTTTIQRLCLELPKDKSILYLTYNKSLKLDAQRKIKLKDKSSSMVQNYHGFSYVICKHNNLCVNNTNSIEVLLKSNLSVNSYDVLIIDEYQDISDEISKLLLKIKERNPNIQIVVVGDMDQRIYDRNLDVLTFFKQFIGKHKEVYLTTCFRLNGSYANEIGIAWDKKINGTNEKCKIMCMEVDEVVSFLSAQNPQDVLVLGKNNYGTRTEIQNQLEKEYPEKYNKNTLYASISDSNETGNTQHAKKRSQNANCALFITYDQCKGLERDTCVICNFDSLYWKSRTGNTNAKYEIMKNLFLVAITRGKKNIIFCNPEQTSESNQGSKRPYPYSVIDEIKKPTSTNKTINDLTASNMYNFRYKENIDELYSELIITEIPQKNQSEIVCKNKEGLIDLSPCVGEYQESIFFVDYDINKEVNLLKDDKKKLYKLRMNNFKKITDKILLFTAIETGQERYISQTQGIRLFEENEETKLIKRLSTHLSKNSKHQITMDPIKIEYANGEQFSIHGVADAQKGNTIYELKYVDEPKKEHFLQLATYMLGLHKSKGVLWNTRKNQYYEVKIKNKKSFVNKIVQAVSNGNYNKGKLKR